MDANTYYMNEHINKIDKSDKAYDNFISSIQHNLDVIQEEIEFIKAHALDFDGYDFTDSVSDLIKDLI